MVLQGECSMGASPDAPVHVRKWSRCGRLNQRSAPVHRHRSCTLQLLDRWNRNAGSHHPAGASAMSAIPGTCKSASSARCRIAPPSLRACMTYRDDGSEPARKDLRGKDGCRVKHTRIPASCAMVNADLEPWASRAGTERGVGPEALLRFRLCDQILAAHRRSGITRVGTAFALNRMGNAQYV